MSSNKQLFVIGLDKELTTPEIKYVIYYDDELTLDDAQKNVVEDE